MPMVDTEGDGRSGDSTLYAWLLRREEEAVRGGGLPLVVGTQPAYPGCPWRLAQLRAGRDVSFAMTDLPPWARERPLTKYDWWDRAVVSPDGSVRYADDNGEWLLENGLLDDDAGQRWCREKGLL